MKTGTQKVTWAAEMLEKYRDSLQDFQRIVESSLQFHSARDDAIHVPNILGALTALDKGTAFVPQGGVLPEDPILALNDLDRFEVAVNFHFKHKVITKELHGNLMKCRKQIQEQVLPKVKEIFEERKLEKAALKAALRQKKRVKEPWAREILTKYQKSLEQYQEIDFGQETYTHRQDRQYVPNILKALTALAEGTAFEPEVATAGMGAIQGLPEDPKACLKMLLNDTAAIASINFHFEKKHISEELQKSLLECMKEITDNPNIHFPVQMEEEPSSSPLPMSPVLPLFDTIKEQEPIGVSVPEQIEILDERVDILQNMYETVKKNPDGQPTKKQVTQLKQGLEEVVSGYNKLDNVVTKPEERSMLQNTKDKLISLLCAIKDTFKSLASTAVTLLNKIVQLPFKKKTPYE